MEGAKINLHTLGQRGEALAAEFLKAKGFEILAQNYRCGRNEIDLIAKRNNVISFVEVKTRRSYEFGHPAEAVTKSKQREIAKAALCYIERAAHQGVTYRFDVVAVMLHHTPPAIELIEDAFRIF
ncbi:MAG: YraN family protein [Chloroherpetonaceae bacterium]|nr:YraN family protein [Chloroherpetonaceae bacterium]MCS7211272.1 YraN family protein [Chloroherpetonaceae bacterium]MDW8019692.1 YraN family protein [Chloroherpetonaceae bacterium]MDW8465227.1 YraN family protein [Chloroherpetonaceae bacterium]